MLSNDLELESTHFDLEQVAYESVMLHSNLAHKKGLKICFQYQPSCPKQFIGDPNRIRQILANIINNAVKIYTPREN